MGTNGPRWRQTTTILLVVLLVSSFLGLGYFYYNATVLESRLATLQGEATTLQGQVSDLHGQVSELRNLSQAADAIKVEHWYSNQTGSEVEYQVRVTNGNRFDITITQLSIFVVDISGNQLADRTMATLIVVHAGNAVTTQITVDFPSKGNSIIVQAMAHTPYGDVIAGGVS